MKILIDAINKWVHKHSYRFWAQAFSLSNDWRKSCWPRKKIQRIMYSCKTSYKWNQQIWKMKTYRNTFSTNSCPETVLNLLRSLKCRSHLPPSWTLVNSQFRSLHLKSLLDKKRSQLSPYIFQPHRLIEFGSKQNCALQKQNIVWMEYVFMCEQWTLIMSTYIRVIYWRLVAQMQFFSGYNLRT